MPGGATGEHLRVKESDRTLGGHNDRVSEAPSPPDRFATPESVARMLGIDVAAVLSLAAEGRIRAVWIGTPQACRIERDSVEGYLDDQAENARRTALWRQAQAASFPELWGHGDVRHPD